MQRSQAKQQQADHQERLQKSATDARKIEQEAAELRTKITNLEKSLREEELKHKRTHEKLAGELAQTRTHLDVSLKQAEFRTKDAENEQHRLVEENRKLYTEVAGLKEKVTLLTDNESHLRAGLAEQADSHHRQLEGVKREHARKMEGLETTVSKYEHHLGSLETEFRAAIFGAQQGMREEREKVRLAVEQGMRAEREKVRLAVEQGMRAEREKVRLAVEQGMRAEREKVRFIFGTQ